VLKKKLTFIARSTPPIDRIQQEDAIEDSSAADPNSNFPKFK
jgi:hypothetical protein